MTAFVLRAVKLFKKSIVKPNKSLSPEELIEAERLWIVHAQTQLKGERDFNTWQKQFNLFPDDKGTKYPLLLPCKAHFTILIVRNAYSRVFHNGVKETLTEIQR